MSSDSEHLLERIHNKDGDALAQYVELNRMALLAFIERRIGAALRRKVEPEDVLQETTLDAVRALPGFELGDRDPFSWLCHIAERRIVDAHRHHFGTQKRDAGREVSLATPGGNTGQAELVHLIVRSMTTPSQAFSRNAREMRLADAIGELPDQQRDALRMRYVEGLPTKVIAERLGKNDGAVRVMLTRSLKLLEQLLIDP